MCNVHFLAVMEVVRVMKNDTKTEEVLMFWMLKENPILILILHFVYSVRRYRCLLLCSTQLCEGCREEEMSLAVFYATVWKMSWGRDVSCCVLHNCVKDVVRKRCLLLCSTQLCEGRGEEEVSLAVFYTILWRTSWKIDVSCCVLHNCVKDVVRNRCLLLCSTQLCEGCHEEEMSLAVFYTTV